MALANFSSRAGERDCTWRPHQFLRYNTSSRCFAALNVCCADRSLCLQCTKLQLTGQPGSGDICTTCRKHLQPAGMWQLTCNQTCNLQLAGMWQSPAANVQVMPALDSMQPAQDATGLLHAR